METLRGLTIGQPIRLEDLMVELYDTYGVTDDELSSAMMSNIHTQDLVVADFPVPPDQAQMGVISIRKVPLSVSDQDVGGYHIYPCMDDAKVYFDVNYGYPGHLTSAETRELAELIKNNQMAETEVEKFMGLSFKFRYPVHPTERKKRKNAVHNPIAIGDYISLNMQLPFVEAFDQLCRLYSFCYDSTRSELRKNLGGFEAGSVQMRLLITGDETLPNILQMTSVPNPGEKPLCVSIYPVALNAEEAGVDYTLSIEYSVPGALTHSEEVEYATSSTSRLVERNPNDKLREFELWAIKRGTLTRTEAAEVRAAGMLNAQSPDRIYFLAAKAAGYGFKNVEEWRKAQSWRSK